MGKLRSQPRFSRSGVVAAVIACLMAIVPGPPSGAHRGYGPSSLAGRWGFFEEFRTADRFGTSIGIIRFDGHGGCRMRGMKNGGDAAEGTEFSGECEYVLRPNGRGAITSAGLPDRVFTMAEHGQAIVFIRSERADFGHGEMRRIGKGSFDETSLAGRWSFIHPAEVGGAHDLTVGIFKFNGSGECVLKYSENGPGIGGASDRRTKFGYEVDPSGWGRIGSGDYIVVTGGGTGAYYMHGQAGNVGWGELTRL